MKDVAIEIKIAATTRFKLALNLSNEGLLMEAEKSSIPEESKDFSILFNKLFGAILINILFKPLPIFTNRIPIEFDLNFSSTLF